MLNKNKVYLFLLCTVISSCYAQNETPKELIVKEIKSKKNITLVQVSDLLEQQVKLHTIDLINWDDFSYSPKVSFRIAHANNQIWLKYYVTEENILAQVDEVNGSVAGDSCV